MRVNIPKESNHQSSTCCLKLFSDLVFYTLRYKIRISEPMKYIYSKLAMFVIF